MVRSIPKINTARVTLRAARPEEFDRYAEIWAMPGVVRHLGGEPWSRARAWQSFLWNAGHWQMTGFGQWVVVLQASRQIVGQTGFFYGARGLGDDFDPFPEAGWVLVPEAQGQGLAAEATAAAHDWFDRVIPGPLVAQISERNAASLRLADRLGYRALRRADTDTGPVLLLRRNGPPGSR